MLVLCDNHSMTKAQQDAVHFQAATYATTHWQDNPQPRQSAILAAGESLVGDELCGEFVRKVVELLRVLRNESPPRTMR